MDVMRVPKEQTSRILRAGCAAKPLFCCSVLLVPFQRVIITFSFETMTQLRHDAECCCCCYVRRSRRFQQHHCRQMPVLSFPLTRQCQAINKKNATRIPVISFYPLVTLLLVLLLQYIHVTPAVITCNAFMPTIDTRRIAAAATRTGTSKNQRTSILSSPRSLPVHHRPSNDRHGRRWMSTKTSTTASVTATTRGKTGSRMIESMQEYMAIIVHRTNQLSNNDNNTEMEFDEEKPILVFWRSEERRVGKECRP